MYELDAPLSAFSLSGPSTCGIGEDVIIRVHGTRGAIITGAPTGVEVVVAVSSTDDQVFLVVTARVPGVHRIFAAEPFSGQKASHTLTASPVNSYHGSVASKLPPTLVMVVYDGEKRTPEEIAILYDCGFLQYLAANFMEHLYLDCNNAPDWTTSYVSQAKRFGLPHVFVIRDNDIIQHFPLPTSITAFVQQLEEVYHSDILGAQLWEASHDDN